MKYFACINLVHYNINILALDCFKLFDILKPNRSQTILHLEFIIFTFISFLDISIVKKSYRPIYFLFSLYEDESYFFSGTEINAVFN